MTKLFVWAAALGLFVSLPACAQNNDHHGDKNDSARSHAERGAPPAADMHNGRAMSNASHANDAPPSMNRNRAAGPSRAPNAVAHEGQPAATRSAVRPHPSSGNVDSQGRTTVNRVQTDPGRNDNAARQRPTNNFQQGRVMRPATAERRPDINSLRQNRQASQHFRGGRYNAPQGYQHRRWSYGERLPHGYYAQNYWIANFMMFDLFAPPSGLIWVRVDDDALLIDQYSGDIVQVRYGVFY